jgi:hypothetical protein
MAVSDILLHKIEEMSVAIHNKDNHKQLKHSQLSDASVDGAPRSRLYPARRNAHPPIDNVEFLACNIHNALGFFNPSFTCICGGGHDVLPLLPMSYN